MPMFCQTTIKLLFLHANEVIKWNEMTSNNVRGLQSNDIKWSQMTWVINKNKCYFYIKMKSSNEVKWHQMKSMLCNQMTSNEIKLHQIVIFAFKRGYQMTSNVILSIFLHLNEAIEWNQMKSNEIKL